MRINIRDIRSEGLELSEKKTPEEMGLDTEEYIKFKDPILIKAFAEKINDTVLVKMHLEGGFETLCARCLESIANPWIKDLLLDFAIDKTTEFIELDDDIRQEMILNVPAKILCKEECKGLCAGCGANLNLEQCKCNKK